MNNGLVGTICFAMGTAAGFFTAQKLLKQRYEQLAQEEIDSVKEVFRKNRHLPEKKKEQTAETGTPAQRHAYQRRTEALGYAQKEEEPVKEVKPYVIAPDELGEMDGYDVIALTYYADGTLTDSRDHAMDESEIEAAVGRESLNHFGEYEPDSVCVRNDRLKTDYEILAEERTYREVLKDKPYLA